MAVFAMAVVVVMTVMVAMVVCRHGCVGRHVHGGCVGRKAVIYVRRVLWACWFLVAAIVGLVIAARSKQTQLLVSFYYQPECCMEKEQYENGLRQYNMDVVNETDMKFVRRGLWAYRCAFAAIVGLVISIQSQLLVSFHRHNAQEGS